MRYFKVFLLIALVLSIGSAKIFAQDMDELKTKIQEMNKEFSETMLAGDNEKMLSYYTDDLISLPSYSPMIEGKEALKQAMMMDANSGNKMTKFDLVSKKIIPAGDLIIDIGTYSLSMNIQGMEQPVDDHGKYVTIYEKQDDGSWKVKIDTWNSDLNPWMNNANMEQTKDDMK